MKRFLLVSALLVATVAAVLAGGGLWYLRSARPPDTGNVVLRGLVDRVEVWRDEYHVPHVWAGTPEDLFFTQGYLHAQDRLWQMELFRRVAEGRLSEVMGDALLPTDRFLRTIGIWRASEAQEAALRPESRRLLEAYARGVNAWLATRPGALPPELVALRTEPEPWTVRHSLAIEKIMAWDLALYGGAAAVTRLGTDLDTTVFRFLQQAYPEWGPLILEAPVPPIPPVAAALLDAVSITRASNAWVIGGARTQSGKPILANDMHLALRAPSLWYLMALHGGGYDVAGMTLPGVPFVVAGHNRAIAWGYTNAMLDDVDFFAERIDAADTTRYLTPAGSEPFVVLEDSIRVRGRAAEPLSIRLTRHGPVLPDLAGEAGTVVAMQWAAHDVSRTLDAVPALNRATGWDDFLAAVRLFDNPHQNVVYADTAGNIGYAMGGRIPRRGDGKKPPILPVPGWTGEWDWNGYLPFDMHPQVLNPSTGYIVTANNRQASGAAADLISSDWEPPYRAHRIREMILASERVSADDVHRMQLDVRDALAARHRGRAVAAARAAGLAGSAQTLERWNLEASTDSEGAALFYAWYDALRSRVRRSLFPSGAGWLPGKAFNVVMDSASLPWLGENGAAALDSLSIDAMFTADSVAGGRTWGELHTVVAEHALASVAALETPLRLNVGPAPAGGAPNTVNVSHFEAGSYPVRAAYGPSQRHVVDMADIDGTGGFILPTGQSGLPFDRHYRDQWPLWLNGGLWRIPLDRRAAESRAVRRLQLIPAEPEG